MQCRKNIKIEVGNTTGYSQLSSVRKLNQNENGSKNSILWLRFPKRLFCGINLFQISYVILRPNLLLLQREGISLIQGIRIIKSCQYKEL